MSSLTSDEKRLRAASLSVSALLASAGGFLDGFTYVGHGRVFANAMTGNVVLLGINMLSGSWRTALRHLPPILAFLLGVCCSQGMQLYSRRRGINPPYLVVLLLEALVMLTLSVLPQTTADIFFTISIAFAASVQVQTFREVNGKNYSSTFTTGNLRTFIEAAFAWFLDGRDTKSAKTAGDFGTICLAFLMGATAGGTLTKAIGNRALWMELGLLAVIAVRIEPGLSSRFTFRR